MGSIFLPGDVAGINVDRQPFRETHNQPVPPDSRAPGTRYDAVISYCGRPLPTSINKYMHNPVNIERRLPASVARTTQHITFNPIGT